MRLAGFEPAFPASERPQTHALDGAATGICYTMLLSMLTYLVFGRCKVSYVLTDNEI